MEISKKNSEEKDRKRPDFCNYGAQWLVKAFEKKLVDEFNQRFCIASSDQLIPRFFRFFFGEGERVSISSATSFATITHAPGIDLWRAFTRT